MDNLQMLTSFGLSRQEKRFNMIANNLSNSQTVGFKKDDSVFKKVLSKSLKGPQNLGEGTAISFQQGAIQKTGNPLDLAIEGTGFFKIETPQGIRYTRAGNFGLNRDNVLVDGNGYPVMGNRGEITLNSKDISIEKDGSIKVDGNEVDKISCVTFSDPSLLKKQGYTLFALKSPQEEMEANQDQVLQGALESSNVNPMEEMIKLVDSLRIYESCVKVIQTNDQLNSRAANEVGKV
jgi:flagellar basal-body rod protein FlgF